MKLSIAAPVVCAALFIINVFLGAPPASATIFCNVRVTSDGYVALRARPHATAKIIARMKGGDNVQGDRAVKMRNGWWYVSWWKANRFQTEKGYSGDRPDGKGWVLAKLIEDECG